MRVSEATVSGRKSAEYLAKAERQISQLDSDNASLRKLRIDLDAASRDNAQQSRLVLSLESQIAILKAENTQLRRANAGTNGGKVNTTSGSGGDYFGYIDQQLPPPSINRISPVSAAIRPPQYRDLELHSVSDLDQYPQHIHPHRIHDGEFSNHQHDPNVTASFSKSPQSLSAFASSSSSSYKNRDLKGNFVGNDHENENNYRNKSEGVNSPRDLIPSTRDQRNPTVSTSISVRTLADLVGDRRNASGFTDASSRDSDSNDEKSRRNEGAVRLSTNLDGNRNWSMSGGNAAPGVSSVNVSPTSVTISSDKKQHSEVKSYRGSSSGGGMSSFHDDSSESASRAPFGTDQSAVVNMVSFEDTDRKLTALMTEKSVLYEESARLQQKGGKVLKDRARLQYIDARLVEVGREIASERKKLSGKPG